MGLRVRPRLASFLAATVFLAGCGGDDNTLFPGEDGSTEAGPDGAGDGSTGGGGPEAGPGVDAGHDSGALDAGHDAAEDADGAPPTDGSGPGDTGPGDANDGAVEAGPKDGGVNANDAGHEADANDGGGLDASDAGHEADAHDSGGETDAHDSGGEPDANDSGGETDANEAGSEDAGNGTPPDGGEGEDGSSGGGDDGGTTTDAGAGDSGWLPDATIDSGADAGGTVNYVPGVTVATLAGSDLGAEVDGTGSAAEFLNPTGVTFDANGDLIVVDYDGAAVRHVTVATGEVTTIAKGTGFAGSFAVVLAYDGSLYVETDFNPQGIKTTTSGTIWLVPPSTDGGVVAPTVVATGFGRPRGLAPLSGADIFFSDRTNCVVQELDVSAGTATPVAGDPTQPGFQNGNGASAHFAEPVGVAVLPDGSYVIADRDNNRIRQVTTSGDVTTFAGTGVATTNDGPSALGASFNLPQALAVDSLGDVFVSDTGSHRIRRILANGTVETVAGDGTAGFQDGAGSTAQFYGGEGLAVTSDGKTLYVTDGNMGTGAPYNRLRVITIP